MYGTVIWNARRIRAFTNINGNTIDFWWEKNTRTNEGVR